MEPMPEALGWDTVPNEDRLQACQGTEGKNLPFLPSRTAKSWPGTPAGLFSQPFAIQLSPVHNEERELTVQ